MKSINTLFSLLLLASPLLGSEIATTGVTYAVPSLFSLNLSPASITVPQTTNADFEQGFLDMPRATQLTGAANESFKATIQAQDPTLNARGKQISDLLWKFGNNSFTPLSTSPLQLHASGQAINPTSVWLDFRLLLDWVDDVPGTYQTTLIITLGPNV